MSLSASQITGRSAELEVETVFTRWGWVVGQDHIDDGYDLLVQPDRSLFKGARFSVQVKGEAKVGKRRTVTAPVSKSRLRQYAEDPSPVIIIRRTGNGELYWLHAQAWAKANPKRLAGNGYAGVRMEPTQKLTDRKAFERFLEASFKPLAQRPNALSHLAEERSVYLNSLDPNLKVEIELVEGKERFTIHAAGNSSKAQIQFMASGDEANVKALSEAIKLGKPAEIQVEDVRSLGSPLLSALGLDQQSSGTISLEPARRRKGLIRLHAGEQHIITSPVVELPAELFVGREGVSVVACHPDRLIEMSADFYHSGAKKGKVELHFTWRDAALSSIPIRDLTALRDWAAWAEAVASKQWARIEFSFELGRPTIAAELDKAPELHFLIVAARTLGRLHLVADNQKSLFQLPSGYGISASESKDIDLAYALLKGETMPVTMGPIAFEAVAPLEVKDYDIIATTDLRIEIGGMLLTELPVKIKLPQFKLAPDDGSPMRKLIKDGKSIGLLSLDERSTATRSPDSEQRDL